MGVCTSLNDKQTVINKLPKISQKTINETKTPPLTSRRSIRYIENEKDLVINADVIVGKAEGIPTENYEIIKRMGEGSYGVVWQVKHITTGLERAMKKIIKSSSTKKDREGEILNEIGILKKLDHPNIVKIFEFYNTPGGYFLITEFCDGGELFKEIAAKAPFSEKVAGHIMYQLLSAVNYCHSNNIIHRDLKPENILITSKIDNLYNIKVIDFGTAKIFEDNKKERKVIGSSYYIAPEVLSKYYNEKCDLWSCGVILYILLCGKAPFAGEKDSVIIEKIKKGKFDLSNNLFKDVSSNAKNLLKRLLQMNPRKRLSAQAALKHSWFKKLEIRNKFTNVEEEDLLQCFENLKSYNPKQKLQQVVLAYLVHNLPQMEGIQESTKIFSKFDENSDGKLTKQELSHGLSKYLGIKESNNDKLVAEIFKKVDNENNGFIQYEEFIRACIDKTLFLDDETLKFAFNYFDKDGSGEITIEEMKNVLCVDNDLVATEKLLKHIMDEIDTDGNGTISFIEFKEMMEKILN